MWWRGDAVATQLRFSLLAARVLSRWLAAWRLHMSRAASLDESGAASGGVAIMPSPHSCFSLLAAFRLKNCKSMRLDPRLRLVSLVVLLS